MWPHHIPKLHIFVRSGGPQFLLTQQQVGTKVVRYLLRSNHQSRCKQKISDKVRWSWEKRKRRWSVFFCWVFFEHVYYSSSVLTLVYYIKVISYLLPMNCLPSLQHHETTKTTKSAEHGKRRWSGVLFFCWVIHCSRHTVFEYVFNIMPLSVLTLMYYMSQINNVFIFKDHK